MLHSGYGPHQIWMIDLPGRRVLGVAPVHSSFGGIAFAADGNHLLCGGGGDSVVHVYAFERGRITPEPDVPIPLPDPHPVVASVIAGSEPAAAFASLPFADAVARVDLRSRKAVWIARLGAPAPAAAAGRTSRLWDVAPNAGLSNDFVDAGHPFGLAEDPRGRRVAVALWGRSEVVVLDRASGAVRARWRVGLHPNQLLFSRDGRRLFVANGGANTVSIVDPSSGETEEVLGCAFSPGDPPGVTPDALAFDEAARRLYVADGYSNAVAVFDLGVSGHARPLGFIPAGWYPAALALRPRGAELLVVSARGLRPHANVNPPPREAPGMAPARIETVRPSPAGPSGRLAYDASLYEGSLGFVRIPSDRTELARAFEAWTRQAAAGRPVRPALAAGDGWPPKIRHVIYLIRENRTYDQVFGDLPVGNGDAHLCLFPEETTPNLHRLVRQFVLLDNFFANAEVSPTGHEWSMAGYAAEFVERTWPVNYGHKWDKVPYPGEGSHAAAIPANGYLWDRAAAAGVSFRDYGEFVYGGATPDSPARARLPALVGRIDPGYAGWDLNYSDLRRADRFIAELHRCEAAGDMPRLQIVRLPNDHTEAGKAGALSPRAFVAQNDAAVGRIVDAVSHSRFWPDTVIFSVEDDAQNGADHVDAHRTVALAISPYVRHHTVDSTPYTTCSLLASIEQILGLQPLSLFDAAAPPLAASFGPEPDLTPYTAVPPRVPLDERNPPNTKAARLSAHFNFRHEDAVEDQLFNRALWATMRGDHAEIPAPVHAAFVRGFAAAEGDD